MNSIFSKVYRYQFRKDRNRKEDFLTEIFAFCLQEDRIFFKAFLSKIGLKILDHQSYLVSTQVVYSGNRPDVEIKWGNCHLLIECKVDSGERLNQLLDYAKILNESEYAEKHLVYLTKYYEAKEISEITDEGWIETRVGNTAKKVQYFAKEETTLSFQHLRWFEIYALDFDQKNQILNQFKQYLKDENMATENSSYQILVTLQDVKSTFSKIDHVLDEITPYVFKEIGLKMKGTMGQRLIPDCYRDYQYFKTKDGYDIPINYGIGWSLGENEEVFLYLDFFFDKLKNHQNAEKYAKLIKENLEGSEYLYDNKSAVSVGFKKPIISYFGETDQLGAMVKDLENWIDKVKVVKGKQPDIFNF